jgi:subtilisin family serine protease
MAFEFYERQPGTISGAGVERVLIKNATDSEITLITTDNDGNIRYRIPISANGSTLHNTNAGAPSALERPNGELFWFYTAVKGTITVNESGKNFELYNEEQDKDAFLFDFEKDPDYSPPKSPYDIFAPSTDVEESLAFDATHAKWFSNTFGYGIPNAARALGVAENGTSLIETNENNHSHLNLLDVHHAWEAGYKGDGVIVAVIDGGFHSHDEMEIDFSFNLESGETTITPEDDYFHGNGTASPIVAKYEPTKTGPDITGIAPEAKLMAIDMKIDKASGVDNAFPKAIRYAVDNGANIIQISWGHNGDSYAADLKSAVQYAYDNDVLIVWAAMNDAFYGLQGMSKTAELGIAIAGGNLNLNYLKLFPDSNLAGDLIYPFFSTPSGNNHVPSSGSDYIVTPNGGTSYASPLISGIAALLYQQNPDITVDQVIEKLALSSWQPTLGKNNSYNEFRQQALSVETIESASSAPTFIDILQFSTIRNDTVSSTISRSSGLTTVDGKSVELVDVERLKFTDTKIAFDTDGNAGDALQLLYAVSKNQYLNNDDIKGLAIELIDKASDRDDVVDYVMGILAGPSWKLNDMTEILARNIYGIEVTGAIDNLIADLMQANEWDDYDFFWAVAESETVASAIGLVGLSDSGITYS